jgi:hypothetical protein
MLGTTVQQFRAMRVFHDVMGSGFHVMDVWKFNDVVEWFLVIQGRLEFIVGSPRSEVRVTCRIGTNHDPNWIRSVLEACP